MMSMSGSDRGMTLNHGCRGSRVFSEQQLQGIAGEIPCEWYGERDELQRLLERLLERRSIVRQLIEDFQDVPAETPFQTGLRDGRVLARQRQAKLGWPCRRRLVSQMLETITLRRAE